MRDSNSNAGLGPYQGGRASRPRPTPQAIAELLKKKIEMRAQLTLLAAQIEEALLTLDEGGAQELVNLLAGEESTLDADIDGLRREAEARAREEVAAANVRPLSVSLTRHSSRLLHQEINRRLADGFCPANTVARGNRDPFNVWRMKTHD
jgi:hypothetical protein